MVFYLRDGRYQLILKEVGRLILIRLVTGLSGAIAAGVLMSSLLFGVRSWDVAILSNVAAVLITSALLASYIPARRAASIDPAEALRAEQRPLSITHMTSCTESDEFATFHSSEGLAAISGIAFSFSGVGSCCLPIPRHLMRCERATRWC